MMNTQVKVQYRTPLYRQQFLQLYIEQREVPKVPDDKVRKLAAITEAEVEDFRANLVEVVEANAKQYEFAKERYAQMLGHAALLYGTTSNAYKYLQRGECVPQKFRFGYYDHDPVREFQRFTDNIQWCREAIEKHDGQAEREARQAAEKQEWLTKAIAYLVAHGRAIGVDFTLDNAVTTANSLAYDLTVAERQATMEGFVSFDGDDGCEDCRGWDGKDNRCDCGNRRVYWACSDWHTFEEPQVYPEVH